jgi:hypothetical protein
LQQQQQAAAGTSSATSSAGSRHDEAAVLGCITQNFLRHAAQLSSSTMLSWEVQYDRDTVQHVLTRPDLAAGLRPKGWEQHPIILDPCCPTNNVAAAVADLSRLKQLAAADLNKVEGSRIALLEQQLQRWQQAQLATVQKTATGAQCSSAATVKAAGSAAASPACHWIWQQSNLQVGVQYASQQVAARCDRRGCVWALSVAQVPAWPVAADGELRQCLKHYSATAYGTDYLAGFAVQLQLAAGKTPERTSLSELELPIPFTVLARSTLTLEPCKTAEGTSHTASARLS